MYPIRMSNQWLFEQRSSPPSQIIHMMKKKSYFCLFINKG